MVFLPHFRQVRQEENGPNLEPCLGGDGDIEDIRALPDEALAIANDDEGNPLVLLRSGSEFEDAIFVWDHDTGEITKIAKDFSGLSPVST